MLNRNKTAISSTIAKVKILLVAGALLSACDGGISGTGDGGPIVVIPDAGSSPTDSLPESLYYEHLTTLPQQSVLALPAPLVSRPSTAQPLNSIAAAHSQLLGTVALTGIQVQTDFSLIEAAISESLQLCANELQCTSVPSEVLTSYSPEISATEQHQLQTFTGTDADSSGRFVSFTDLTFGPSLSGYYDQSLTYSREDGSRVRAQWTAGSSIVSLLVDSSTMTLHTLLEKNSTRNRMTFRVEDRSGSSVRVLNAVAESAADVPSTVTVISDLYIDRVYDVHAIGNDFNAAVFTRHPTDTNQARQRELITANGQIYNIQSCTNISDCNDWITVFTNAESADPEPDTKYTELEAQARDVAPSQGITVTNLSADVLSFVLAAGTSAPSAADIVCSGQQQIPEDSDSERTRLFCWQPLPLQQSVRVYRTISNSGTLEYQLLDGTTINP